jgi:peptidoglycan/xylan/chitin deacetylase (PgdA/CDA1 family)
MKLAVLMLMRATGAFAAFRLAHRRRILILTYHRFSDRTEDGSTSRAAFSEQLSYLRRRYTIVPLSAIERHFTEGAPLPDASAAITIDDGYRDAYEVAFPILRRYDAPAALFAVTDFIDQKGWLWTDKLPYVLPRTAAARLAITLGGSTVDVELNGRESRRQTAARINESLKSANDDAKEQAIRSVVEQAGVELPAQPPPECSALTWSELREMSRAGIEIGSHTVTHPILSRVDAARLRRELRDSRSRLEAMLDREVRLFCYPNGTFTPDVRDEVGRAGYRLAVTTRCGLNSAQSDPLSLQRIHTERDLAHFVQSTSGFEPIKNNLRRLMAHERV